MKVLGYDLGLSLEHFARLVRDGHEVKLYTPWQTAFPKFNDFAVGLGFDGIQKVLYFFDHVDWADLLVFFDVGNGDLVSFLRKKGYLVFGGGRKGDELEENRLYLKKIQKKLNIPIPPYVVVKGVDALRDYLAKNKDKYVKINIFRGDIESFYAKDLDTVEIYLNELEVALGPFANQYLFVVEQAIHDAVEPGFDLFFNGKEFVKPYLYGIEFEKSCYVGRFVNILPKPLELVKVRLEEYLRSIDYRGALSTEIRITKDGRPYLIDVCSRLPYPLSAIYTEAISNYSELIYKVARGEEVRIVPTSEYVACLPLSSTAASTSWLKLDFDPKLRKYVKMRLACKTNNSYYSVKGMEVVYVLVAVGSNLDEVKKILENVKEKVDARGLITDTSLEPLYQEVEKARKFGIPF